MKNDCRWGTMEGKIHRLRWSSQPRCLLSNMDTIPSVGGVSTPAAKRDIRCLSRQSKRLRCAGEEEAGIHVTFNSSTLAFKPHLIGQFIMHTAHPIKQWRIQPIIMHRASAAPRLKLNRIATPSRTIGRLPNYTTITAAMKESWSMDQLHHLPGAEAPHPEIHPP